MAKEQERQSQRQSTQGRGNGGTLQTATRPETTPRQGDGPSGQLERTSQRAGQLQTTRGWPGLLGGGIPSSPWELVRRMTDEMNQLFESLGGTGPAPAGLERRRQTTVAPLLVPRTEVIQQPNALLVRVEMPGMAADDIEVTVENGMLTIAGERRREDYEEGQGFVRSELVYGTFFRTIPLPDGADEEGIVAVVRNGVLEVTVPLSQREKGRRVSVQSGEEAEAGRIGAGGKAPEQSESGATASARGE